MTATRRLRTIATAALILACCACAVEGNGEDSAARSWRELEPGLELGRFPVALEEGPGGAEIHVLRIDPHRFALRLLNASAPGQGRALTAAEWCKRNGLTAAINASMYQEDLRTSVSLMRSTEHVNNAHVTLHRAVLAFDARDPAQDPVKIIDLECDSLEDWQDRYGTLVQSIRMLSCKGRNVWSPQPQKWSTAAIGIDGAGRVLFVHVRSPFSTHDLIDVLIDLPLGLRRLMYAEGGPEAQLYVAGPDRDYEFVGSYESAFEEDEDSTRAWPIPNVIGVVRRGDGGPAGG